MGENGVRSGEQRGTCNRWDLHTPDQKDLTDWLFYQAVAGRKVSGERRDMDKSKSEPWGWGS